MTCGHDDSTINIVQGLLIIILLLLWTGTISGPFELKSWSQSENILSAYFNVLTFEIAILCSIHVL